MNKSDLTLKVCKDTGLSQRKSRAAINSFLNHIAKAMKKSPVTLADFGTFTIRKRKARIGRNPQTGEVIKIQARRVPTFKPGKLLKEMTK